jgi:hypothetical protein
MDTPIGEWSALVPPRRDDGKRAARRSSPAQQPTATYGVQTKLERDATQATCDTDGREVSIQLGRYFSILLGYTEVGT